MERTSGSTEETSLERKGYCHDQLDSGGPIRRLLSNEKRERKR